MKLSPLGPVPLSKSIFVVGVYSSVAQMWKDLVCEKLGSPQLDNIHETGYLTSRKTTPPLGCCRSSFDVINQAAPCQIARAEFQHCVSKSHGARLVAAAN
jgi:hypothetical protein